MIKGGTGVGTCDATTVMLSAHEAAADSAPCEET